MSGYYHWLANDFVDNSFLSSHAELDIFKCEQDKVSADRFINKEKIITLLLSYDIRIAVIHKEIFIPRCCRVCSQIDPSVVGNLIRVECEGRASGSDNGTAVISK